MRTLKDQLLRAQLISEREAIDATRKQRTEKRQSDQALSKEEKEQRRHAQVQPVDPQEAERRRVAREEQLARNREREARERQQRVRQLVAEHLIASRGNRTFYFVSRARKVPCVTISDELAKRLESGGAAIVEAASGGGFAVVPKEAAQRIREIDPEAIRFLVEAPASGQDSGDGAAPRSGEG